MVISHYLWPFTCKACVARANRIWLKFPVIIQTRAPHTIISLRYKHNKILFKKKTTQTHVIILTTNLLKVLFWPFSANAKLCAWHPNLRRKHCVPGNVTTPWWRVLVVDFFTTINSGVTPQSSASICRPGVELRTFAAWDVKSVQNHTGSPKLLL